MVNTPLTPVAPTQTQATYKMRRTIVSRHEMTAVTMATRTCFIDESAQHRRANGRHLARLADDRVTAGERRRQLEREQIERQVPGADERRHADWTTLRVAQ